MDFFSRSKRVIRVSTKTKRATCSRKPAGNTSPSCTRTDMLRGFLLIYLLTGIVIVAIFGFRGEHSTGSPIEVFPDMVRQQKVRAQAPLAFFADDGGPRVPVANTVPVGYEMPRPQENAPPEVSASGAEPGHELSRQRLGFSGGTGYCNTGQMGTNWGTGFPVPVTAEL